MALAGGYILAQLSALRVCLLYSNFASATKCWQTSWVDPREGAQAVWWPLCAVIIHSVFISLQQLERRPVRFDIDIPAGEIDYDSDMSQSSVLHADGSAELLNHSLGEIRIHGQLRVTVQATCDRCLESASFPIDKRFDLVYMPAGESNGGEKEVDEAGIEVGYYEGNGLALNDVLREIVLLALPMQLVCNEACKGICPVCGQDRNLRDCGCEAQPVDDRWRELQAFRGAHSRN